jgi:hypothetical protein
MSNNQLYHGALVEANRRALLHIRHVPLQFGDEGRPRKRTALRGAELMRDSYFDNLRTANASIARLREALMEARQNRRRASGRADD